MARVNRDGRASTTQINIPAEQELAIARNYESRLDPSIARRVASGRGGYAMSADDAIAAASLMDRSRVVSPFAGLPTAASVGEFKGAADPYENEQIARQELARMHRMVDDESFWAQDYDADQTGYNYNFDSTRGGVLYDRTQNPFKAMGAKSPARTPAPISIVPTSTEDPSRPRTVAAGYDARRQVLTVVFRDGTFYNYYNVNEDEWSEFKSEHSKGKYILRVLDGKPRGTANMANRALAAREGLYRIARTGQWLNDGQVSGQYDRSLAPRLNPTKSRSRKKK